MSLFKKNEAKNNDAPENKKDSDKVSAVQWVKNSGHSLKGLFLEWLSEQQLFSVVHGEIKAIKKERAKRKMSPKEKKSFKAKLADLSENAIAKFGHDYLGKDSPEETKQYVKDGLGIIMKQIKTGNFHAKENLFGDDEEMEDFMSQLEDEWDEDEDNSAGSESFRYEDLVHKYKRGFSEFMPSVKKNTVKSEKVPGLERVKSKFHDNFFMETFSKSDFKFKVKDVSDSLNVYYYVDYDDEDITDIQFKLRKDLLLDKTFLEKVKKAVTNKDVIRKYDIKKLVYIYNIAIYKDGAVEATARYVFKDDEEGDYEGDGNEVLVMNGKGESVEIIATELVTGSESYDENKNENKKLYNLRKNVFG